MNHLASLAVFNCWHLWFQCRKKKEEEEKKEEEIKRQQKKKELEQVRINQSFGLSCCWPLIVGLLLIFDFSMKQRRKDQEQVRNTGPLVAGISFYYF